MHNPSYLTLSRHGIYYLRFPIPWRLHPEQKASTVKLSLQTSNATLAVKLARALSCSGETVLSRPAVQSMNYSEIRGVLTRHFQELLRKRQRHMNEHGRLTASEKSAGEAGVSFATHAVLNDYPLIPGQDDDVHLSSFIEKYELPVTKDSPAYGTLRAEFSRAYRDYCKNILAYDQRLETYAYDEPANTNALSGATEADAVSIPLSELVKSHTEERLRAKAWSEKTTIERADHFRLLFEILGSNTDTRQLTTQDAARVKNVLLSYPKNRNKNPQTRNKSLSEALAVSDTDKISVTTINKYLQTYSDLFKWAKGNGHHDVELFAGSAVRMNRKQSTGDREAFTADQVRTILTAVETGHYSSPRKPYQKWGPLIGLYTGARLNEIAQIYLDDIKQDADGRWYFDINDLGDGTHLKTQAAKRLVPVHSALIRLGFIEHVQKLRQDGHTKLFDEFTYCPKNGWGRTLGRWFNDRFLVELQIKRPGLVFHSFRHTVITALAQADVADPIIKAIVGHAQQGVTHQHYMKAGYTLPQLSRALEELRFGFDASQQAIERQ
ncbi:site-specific integrase [Jiella marina]|uniref:site-specific integrase n=1 Tax=Jiella sp. LLJ827 TaxID=2917712 RepID=UPI002100E2D7|nr:site-specific integrase [Jiella sp. LLJ827]MCQ0990072.1 site-specific integrase [Jiella sp. LLJ827]